MPRIDPIQLLNCLSVLLSPNGGIKSRNEVQRLAGLMTKFSKKLVSKCIYIQILKCTETELLGSFMGSGGWLLVHVWLTESIVAKNWPLVKELLELLLLCPVDIERLKTNNCPKLVKELSKDGNHIALRALASKLVEQWLKTVKGEVVVPIKESDISEIIMNADSEIKTEVKTKLENDSEINLSDIKKEPAPDNESVLLNNESFSDGLTKKSDNVEVKKDIEEQETLPVLKITLKDGKQVIEQIDDSEAKDQSGQTDKNKDKNKTKSKEKSSEKSSSSSKYSSKSRSSSSSNSDKYKSRSSSSKSKDGKDRERSSSHSSRSKSDSNKSNDRSSSSSKHKDDRNHKSEKNKDRDKDKHPNKYKQDKEKPKDAQKTSNDKSEDKVQTPSIHKLGKIPKLSDVKKDKHSISIEIRSSDEPKPKTVKTFNSKFRKHGLEEEVKPPPSRATVLNKKVVSGLPPTVSMPKRPSPVHNDSPPEKKPKTVELVDKPGAIKLIPPKPKPMLLLESDMFMDALNASATNKKEPKKRKRRTSGSKDGNAANDVSPPHTPTSLSSPSSESKSVPPRFYQDTLDTEDNKEKSVVQSPERRNYNEKRVSKIELEEPMDIAEPHTLTINGLKGVLCYHKRKGPKKSIKWKPDTELEEIQYFELDETERVNVTKTFTDMKYLERIHERDAFQKSRNIVDDVMEEKTTWRPLILLDAGGKIVVDYGKNSKEKDIQAIRQKGTLQPLYFHKAMIPDSPHEPDAETHTYSEPTIIPLDDITGNQDNISDFRNMPWPEPKGNAPPVSANVNMPAAMFPPNIAQFPNGFPGAQFPGVPGYQPPNMVPSEWQNGISPHMMVNGIPGQLNPSALPPGSIPPVNVPPGIMMAPENMMMGPEMFGGPNPLFPGPPDGFNMQQNMFPMDFNMAGPQGPGPEFPNPGNFRGAMRGGRGTGGHWRGKGSGNWDNGPQRGRGGHSRGGRKAVCMYFQRKGSCRQGDNCSFLHPGVNCPF